ncbi:MAG: TIGR02117 family protein [Bacteroidota bacterium]
MKIIYTTLRIVLKSFLYLGIGILLYLFMAILFTLIPVNSSFKESKEGTEIFINTNGVHTNIILPTKTNDFDWNRFLKIKENYEYLAFGWGDKEFYLNTPTWDDLKISTALKAAFLPTKTIIQVNGYSYKPKESETVIKLKLNEDQFQKISYFVAESFKQSDKNQIIKINPNNKYGFKEKFYLAKGTYSLLKTCNNWTNKGLKQAGIKNAFWAPFDKSVMYHLNEY